MNLFTNRIIQTNNITANSGGWLAPVTVHDHRALLLTPIHCFHAATITGQRNSCVGASAVLCPVSSVHCPHCPHHTQGVTGVPCGRPAEVGGCCSALPSDQATDCSCSLRRGRTAKVADWRGPPSPAPPRPVNMLPAAAAPPRHPLSILRTAQHGTSRRGRLSGMSTGSNVGAEVWSGPRSRSRSCMLPLATPDSAVLQ